MKIIQIGPVTPEYGGSYVGGIATHLIQLVKALAKKNVKSLILSTNQIYHLEGDVNVVGMANKIRLINLFIRSPICFLYSALRGGKSEVINTAYEHYIKSKFSSSEIIILVHSLHCTFADNLLSEYKVIYTDHGFWQKKSNDELIKNRIEKSSHIISVSNYAKKILIESFPMASSKTSVIYNPINKPTCEELSFSNKMNEKGKIIFFNGYSESIKRKGLDLLVQTTIPDLNREQFEIIADDEGKNYIEVKNFQNVNVYGKQPYKTIANLYQKSKLMVLPSRSESFGIVYIEAASYGVPVIGFKPMIEEFNEYLGLDIGFGFDPEQQSTVDLKALVSRTLDTNWDKEKMQKVVAGKFSWEYLSENFIKIYTNDYK
ncbi:glycosyltransferase family 4 protein [Aliivibrio sp. SR45-2]|uniref:glycosyltransferase family 4 protein n=1 Tax=Aliivibrio sp. SR45-2 TaxID=2760931 RepID=UPI0015FB83B9|nr:glycosyltransferase family 4 protein [Aliivibrio sp. SR45-2]MBB1315472.1 glycosyltransferase family 4 protein [Aliivibrio sp. SR45-2]